MVECEFKPANPRILPFWVLIDTWWNVNNFSFKFTLPQSTVLIDTWWNVNENANLAFMEIFAF